MASIIWCEGNEIDADKDAIEQIDIEEACNNLPALKTELSRYFFITPGIENKLCLGILRVHGKQINYFKDFLEKLYIKKYWREPKEKELKTPRTYEVEKVEPTKLESRQLTDDHRCILEINRIPGIRDGQEQPTPATLSRILEPEPESVSTLMIPSRVTDQPEVLPSPGARGPTTSTPYVSQRVTEPEVMTPVTLEQEIQMTRKGTPYHIAEIQPPSEVPEPTTFTPYKRRKVSQAEVMIPVTLEQEIQMAQKGTTDHIAEIQSPPDVPEPSTSTPFVSQRVTEPEVTAPVTSEQEIQMTRKGTPDHITEIQPPPEVPEPSAVLQLDEITEELAVRPKRVKQRIDVETVLSSDLMRKWLSNPRRWLRVKGNESDIIDIQKQNKKDMFKKAGLFKKPGYKSLPKQLGELYERHLVTCAERTYSEEELERPTASSIVMEETSRTTIEAPTQDVIQEHLEPITEEPHPTSETKGLPEPGFPIPEAPAEAPPLAPGEVALAPHLAPVVAVEAAPPALEISAKAPPPPPEVTVEIPPPKPEAVPDAVHPSEAIPGAAPPPEAIPGAVPPPEAIPGAVPPPEAIPGAVPPPEAIPGAVPPPEAIPGAIPPPEAILGAIPPPEIIPGAAPPPSDAILGPGPPAPEVVSAPAPPPEAIPGAVPPPEAILPVIPEVSAEAQPLATEDERITAGIPNRSQILDHIHNLQRKNKHLTVSELCRGISKQCAVSVFKNLLEMHEDELIFLSQDLQSCPPVIPLPPIYLSIN